MAKILGICIIPSTSWYNNVRSNFSKEEWNLIRKACYKKANHVCEICKGSGLKQNFEWPVECHEIWEFDDKKHIQKLIRLIALCPMCHKAQHPGLAQIQGFYDQILEHYSKVNNVTIRVAKNDYDKAFKEWEKRSRYTWRLDLSILEKLINI